MKYIDEDEEQFGDEEVETWDGFSIIDRFEDNNNE